MSHSQKRRIGFQFLRILADTVPICVFGPLSGCEVASHDFGLHSSDD